MRRLSAPALALLLGVAACSEVVTSPEQTGVRSPSYGQGVDIPPPPPADFEALGEVVFGSSEAAGGGEFGTSALGPFQFELNVTYFFNRTGNSGWLKIKKEQDDNVDGTGKVNYSQGVFSGSGVIDVTLSSGLLTFDLANVSQASTFASCALSSPPPPESAPTAASTEPRPEGTCFNVIVDDATYQPFLPVGAPPETVTVIIRPQCVVDDIRPVCNPIIIID